MYLPARRLSLVASLVLLAGLLIGGGCSSSAPSGTTAPRATASSANPSGQTGQVTAQSSPGSRGERGETGESGEGGESTEGGEHASTQSLSLTITDAGMNPAQLNAHAGLLTLTVTNHGQQAHDVTITGNGTHGDMGTIAPGQAGQIRGNLKPGSYQIAVDAQASPPGKAVAMLGVQ